MFENLGIQAAGGAPDDLKIFVAGTLRDRPPETGLFVQRLVKGQTASAVMKTLS